MLRYNDQSNSIEMSKQNKQDCKSKNWDVEVLVAKAKLELQMSFSTSVTKSSSNKNTQLVRIGNTDNRV